MNCVMRTRLIGHLCVPSRLLAGCGASVKSMHSECQFSESFRQWFFRIIPPLAGAALFRVYGISIPWARGLTQRRGGSARA